VTPALSVQDLDVLSDFWHDGFQGILIDAYHVSPVSPVSHRVECFDLRGEFIEEGVDDGLAFVVSSPGEFSGDDSDEYALLQPMLGSFFLLGFFVILFFLFF